MCSEAHVKTDVSDVSDVSKGRQNLRILLLAIGRWKVKYERMMEINGTELNFTIDKKAKAIIKKQSSKSQQTNKGAMLEENGGRGEQHGW